MNRLVLYFSFFSMQICLKVEPVRANFRLLVLHNNDLHARFVETEEHSANSASCPQEFVQQNKCYGGFARMKKAADEARQDAKSKGLPSIFLNAGDSFQGTPYYTIYKWQIVFELVDKLGLDVMSLGNHEFDDGINNLVEYLKHVKTPVVCANINTTGENRLDLPNLTPSKILTVEGRKIGVIGYLTPDTKDLSNSENLQIFEEIPYIRREAQRLKSQGVKIIIALGHSGFNYDVKIATEVEEVSLVVGGHSHSLLYTPRDKPPSVESVTSEYPTMVTQKSGKTVPVVQAYAFSKYLGKLTVEFDDEGNVLDATGNPQLLDFTVKKDVELDNEISKWSAMVNEKVRLVKGYTRTCLNKPIFNEGKFESSLGNLIADAYLDFGAHLAKERKEITWTKTPIVIYQNRGIRAVIDNQKNEGALTLEDILTVLPFGNNVVELRLRGSTIKKALEFSVSMHYKESTGEYFPSFVHISGLRVVYDLTKPPSQRVVSVHVLCTKCEIPKFRALQDDDVYGVITGSFLANGGDKFSMIKDEAINKTVLNFIDVDPVIAYIEKNRVIYPHLDNRITVTGLKLKDPSAASFASAPSSCFSLLLIAVLASLTAFL